MKQLTPYIKFNDAKCRVAMNFYKSVFGGVLEFMTLGESPMAKDMPGKENLIMHSTLKKGGITLIGSDMMRDTATIGDNVGIAIECESEKGLNDIFDKLSKGGEIFMKPEYSYWGGVFGMTTDKYGVEWMLNFQKTSMDEVMKSMKKEKKK